MLLKYSNSEKRIGISSKGGSVRGTAMRMTMSTASTMTPRIHRKVLRIPSKRHPGKVLPGKLHAISRTGPGKIGPGKRINIRPDIPVCDNSNDSGLGFDQHVEVTHHTPHLIRTIPSSSRSKPFGESSSEESDGIGDGEPVSKAKCRTVESLQIDNDDACSNDAFVKKIMTTTTSVMPVTNSIYTSSKYISTVGRNGMRPSLKRPAPSSQINIHTASKDGSVQLEIVTQPEQQHRARYQTEGSRGAVKDRSGNGFPVVKLTGYNKPAVLQVFIGTDIGRVAPHMFYQACKVAGKNSTPCNEKKVDGTMVIEIDFKAENEMVITCDCVGILKERNVDVEHRFPDHSTQRSKKKSTRCRMVFRTQLVHDDGTLETLQVCSHPIICTQPPGVPEICKKSLNSCPVEGGLELFIIGKNFLKDTCVVFQSVKEESNNSTEIDHLSMFWEETVLPDKEYLQQTHLICTVPPFAHQNITNPVTVHFFVMSGGKRSESHNFIYTTKGEHSILAAATTMSVLPSTISRQQDAAMFTEDAGRTNSLLIWGPKMVEPKHEIDSGMMPPPTALPPTVRRSSSSGALISDQVGLKTELTDDNSQSSISDVLNPNSINQFSSANENSVTDSSTTVKEMTYQQGITKQSVDMIDMEAMLNDTNNLPTYSSHENHTHLSVVDLHAKQQEQIAAQMLTAAQNQKIDKYISTLENSIIKLKPEVSNGQISTMFVDTTANNNQNVIFSHQQIDEMNTIAATNTNGNLDQNFARNILTNAGSTATLTQILNIPQTTASSVLHSPPSNSSSPGAVHSAITQDIILNSQPAASINSANMQMISTATNGTPQEHITSELILNTTVSPTMMCRPTTENNSLMAAHQVTIANTMLADMNMTPQREQDNLINNIIMNRPSDELHVHKTSPVAAVNNLILTAAADYITNQDTNINTESTINALMSLNSNSMLTAAQTTVPQILNIQTQQSVNSTSNIQQTMDMCPAQPGLSQHISLFTSPHQLIERTDLQPTNTTVPIGNLLVTTNAQNAFIHDIQKANNHLSSDISSTKNQDSLLQAVSLVRNEIQKSKMENTVGDITISQTNNMVQNNVPQPVTTTATIPQELTTMSDQDLISYINPSCFDQV